MRSTVFGVATRYGLDGPGFESRHGQEPFLRNVQTGSGSHHLPFSGYRGSASGVKRPGLEVNHSPPSIAVVENEWSCNFAPPGEGKIVLYISLREVLVGNS